MWIPWTSKNPFVVFGRMSVALAFRPMLTVDAKAMVPDRRFKMSGGRDAEYANVTGLKIRAFPQGRPRFVSQALIRRLVVMSSGPNSPSSLTPAGLSIEAPIAQLSSLIVRGNIDKPVFENGGASPNNCKGGTHEGTHGYHLANGTRPQTTTITPQHG